MNVRQTRSADLSGIEAVLDETPLFPKEILGDLIAGFLSEQESEDLWLTCEKGGTIAGFCYAVPEMMTDGTWNMLAIGVHPSRQGTGCGRALVAHLETALKERGNRILIVDTSSSDDYAEARAFYVKNGYEEEARIRDFWSAGDDKITFRKALD